MLDMLSILLLRWTFNDSDVKALFTVRDGGLSHTSYTQNEHLIDLMSTKELSTTFMSLRLFTCFIYIKGNVGVDGWIILGWISRRWDVGIWTGLGWPRIETGGGRL